MLSTKLRGVQWVRAAYLLVGDLHRAEDLVQGTLVRAWPRWRRICAQGDPDAYVRKAIFHQFCLSREQGAGKS